MGGQAFISPDLMNASTTGKSGYANHPETLRWRGRLRALYGRHDGLVEEMNRRGFNHRSPLDSALATGAARQTELLDSVEHQRERLRLRDCPCFSHGQGFSQPGAVSSVQRAEIESSAGARDERGLPSG